MYKKLIFSALALGCSGSLPTLQSELDAETPRGAASAQPPEVSDPVTIFSARSPFNQVLVQEAADGRRDLLFEPSLATQSSIRVGFPLDLQLAYTRAAMVALAAHPAPRRALVVGLGGGAMPMFLRAADPALAIDVVDIDPLVRNRNHWHRQRFLFRSKSYGPQYVCRYDGKH